MIELPETTLKEEWAIIIFGIATIVAWAGSLPALIYSATSASITDAFVAEWKSYGNENTKRNRENVGFYDAPILIHPLSDPRCP
jgi:hypothetical protein